MDIDAFIALLRQKNPDGSRRIYQNQATENRQSISSDELVSLDIKEESVKKGKMPESKVPSIFDGSAHIWKM